MHNPRKRFGQNFLHDATVIDTILASVYPQTADHWVEIGPGLGALTEPLLKTASCLDVIEIDRDLVNLLKKKFANCKHLQIYGADALNFDFSELTQNGSGLRIIGNLPYNISTPLLFHLVEYAPLIRDMHFMLQKEVVDRICASPGSKTYGKLSIMMQYYCQAEPLFEVLPGSFTPAPKVVSAVLKLTPYVKPPVQVDNLTVFSRLLADAFSQRRKTVRNSLKKKINEDMFQTASIDSNLRPEALTLAEFAKLSNLLTE